MWIDGDVYSGYTLQHMNDATGLPGTTSQPAPSAGDSVGPAKVATSRDSTSFPPKEAGTPSEAHTSPLGVAVSGAQDPAARNATEGPRNEGSPAPDDDLVRVRPPIDPRLPPCDVPGLNGGRLYRGGIPFELRTYTPGNPVGRKPRSVKLFREKMRSMADSKALARSIRTILCDPDHEHFGRIAEFVVEQGYGRVPTKIEAEHTHRHAVVLLPPMDAQPARVVQPALEAVPLAALPVPTPSPSPVRNSADGDGTRPLPSPLLPGVTYTGSFHLPALSEHEVAQEQAERTARQTTRAMDDESLSGRDSEGDSP